MKKISSIHYGGVWIAAGLAVGVALPLALRVILGRMIWPLVIAGGVILAAFGVVSAIGTHRDSGRTPHSDKTPAGAVPYDPEKQYPVIRSSICTGEKVAGFKNKADGHFTEVMVIRSPQEEQCFKDIYHLDSVKTEY